MTRAYLAVGLVLLAVLVTAPRVPYGWDAVATWGDRAQREREETGALLRTMRTPADWALLGPEIGTHTYPVAYPMIVGHAARLLPAHLSAKRAADAVLGVAIALLLWQLARREALGVAPADSLPVLLVLVGPFVAVHLRAGYVDLLLGVLAASAATAALAALRAPSYGRWLAWTLVASVACQTKEDGVVLVLAGSATATAMACAGGRPPWRAATYQLLVPLANVAAWRLLVAWSFGPGMPPPLRGVVGLDVGRMGEFAWQAARHLLDVDTWGWTWGVLLGLAVVRRNGWWVAYVAGIAAVYALAHAVGPPQMMDYLANGTVMHRLLLQVLVSSLPFALSNAGRRPDVAAASRA